MIAPTQSPEKPRPGVNIRPGRGVPFVTICCTKGTSMTSTSAIQPSYDHGPGDRPLLGETIGENFDRIATVHADREAMVDRPTGRRWTYAELHRDVLALAHGLLGLGIGKGDRVGIWAPNRPEWTLLQYATAEIGAILVPINPAYRTDELAYVVRQAGIRLLVAAPSFRTSDYAAMIEDARPECPGLRWVVLLGSADWHALPDPAGDPCALAARQALLSPDDPINIQYTSGTTGHPKGATLSHHNILNNAHLTGEIVGYTEFDRICVPVPLYHTFGMVIGNLGATTHGACLVYPAQAFDPAATLAAVAEERCTSLYGVPAMFIAELAEPGFGAYDLSSLRTGIIGGAPCPVEVMRQLVDRMGLTGVTIAYGMTETSPVSAQTRPDDTLDRRVSTVGRVHPHVEIKIVDPETGVTVPRGVPGELCTRGYSVMLGYWQQPGKTAEAVDAARWMQTGDLATMDADGYVNITGRLKDMVTRGGRTSRRARSRNSCTPTRTSGTSRSSGYQTRDSAKRSWRGSGCIPAPGRSPRPTSGTTPAASSPTTRSPATCASWRTSR